MNKTYLIIIAIWVFVLADALRQGASIPSSEIASRFNDSQIQPLVILVPFLFFLVVPFFNRGETETNEFIPKSISAWVDNKFGKNATQLFLGKLQPVKLFMCAALTLGISGIVATYKSTNAYGSYNISAFFAAAGFGLLLSRILITVLRNNDNTA